jgi:hypothetical protein
MRPPLYLAARGIQSLLQADLEIKTFIYFFRIFLLLNYYVMISLAVGFGILFILSMAERSIVAREIVFNSKTLLLLFKNTMGLQGIIEILIL